MMPDQNKQLLIVPLRFRTK